VTLEERLWRGGYPALHARHRRPDPPHWFAGYVATYVERDVRQLLNVGNLLTFQRFLAMCAARSGQLLNLNSLASDCGISQPTARQWLTVLQASHLVALVPPYHRNFGKRQVKTPKLYFLDSGLLCHLLRIATPGRPAGACGPRRRVRDLGRGRDAEAPHNLGLPPDLYFWRDNHGLEVDLVFEHQGRLHGVECKSAPPTPATGWPARRWRAGRGGRSGRPAAGVWRRGQPRTRRPQRAELARPGLARACALQRMTQVATHRFWHKLDLFLARLRPHREPLSLLVDAVVMAACWNITYLFRLGFERWISARPSYDGWVLLGVVRPTWRPLWPSRCRRACGASRALARSSGSRWPVCWPGWPARWWSWAWAWPRCRAPCWRCTRWWR
jgi:hypothetical protein